MNDSHDDSGWVLVTEDDRHRAGVPGWLSIALGTGALVAAIFGCKQEAPTVGEESSAVARAAAAEPASAKASFNEEAFSLEIATKGSYAAGKEAQAEIHLKAKSGFKCNDKYPYKFKVKPSSDIEYAADVVRKDAVRIDGKSDAYMTVKFTPKAAGKKIVEGQFSFSVCTEEQCLVERRDLALAIDVK